MSGWIFGPHCGVCFSRIINVWICGPYHGLFLSRISRTSMLLMAEIEIEKDGVVVGIVDYNN
jgi:hypothetical protein